MLVDETRVGLALEEQLDARELALQRRQQQRSPTCQAHLDSTCVPCHGYAPQSRGVRESEVMAGVQRLNVGEEIAAAPAALGASVSAPPSIGRKYESPTWT